jgi:hypothetical protein
LSGFPEANLEFGKTSRKNGALSLVIDSTKAMIESVLANEARAA